MKKRFVFCHGFGFDADFWNNLRPYFSKEDCLFLDLGYFGKENMHIPIDHDVELIGIGHSIGLMKLIALDVNFTKLIGLQGFINFLGFDQNLNKKRRYELEDLRKAFAFMPKLALSFFYKHAGASVAKEKLSQINKNKMLNDLDYLATKVEIKTSTLIIGSKDDVIVTPELINDNFASLAQVEIVMCEKGMHCLGNAQPEFVYQEIMRFVGGA